MKEQVIEGLKYEKNIIQLLKENGVINANDYSTKLKSLIKTMLEVILINII